MKPANPNMRSILRIILIILTFIAAVWMTASDVFMHVIHGLPKNSIQFTSTSTEQHFHFSHSATGTAWLLWIAILLGGWLTKRWGKKQFQLGIVVGILGTLPLLPFMNIGSKSIGNISHRFDIVDVLLVLLVVLVLLSKLTIWRYWWKLVVGGSLGNKKAGKVY